jgi:hypothetical protein
LTETNERYKRPPSRRKKSAPVKRITLSAADTQAYVDEAQKRADRDRDYGRHLAADNKVK